MIYVDKTVEQWLKKYPYMRNAVERIKCTCGLKPDFTKGTPWVGQELAGISFICECGRRCSVSGHKENKKRLDFVQKIKERFFK